MKKNLMLLVAAAFVLSLGYISALCQLTPQLVSQDPYPAVPGDYVKLVFQVNGIADPNCGTVSFRLVPNYPISFDSGTSPYSYVQGGTYAGTTYSTYAMVPYTVRIDPNAVNGNSTIDFQYAPNSVLNYSVDTYFNLKIQDVRSSFQVFVKNYDFVTKDVTLEIMNIGKNDVESLTVTMPQQQRDINVSGPNTYIVGSLSSNDFTTADFKVTPTAGTMNMNISYNDLTGVRRTVSQSVYFDPTAFVKPTQTSAGLYVVIVLVILVVVYIIYRKRKKARKKKLLRE